MTTRPHIRVPAPEEWATAQAQFEAGDVLGLPLRTPSGEHVTLAATAAWLERWTSLPLTHLERIAIRNVCRQLNRGWVHPAADTRPLELPPSGAWVGSPTPGYTLTWRQHWSDPEVPVLLTLTANEAAPPVHHQRETVDTDVPARRRSSFYALPRSRKSSDAD